MTEQRNNLEARFNSNKHQYSDTHGVDGKQVEIKEVGVKGDGKKNQVVGTKVDNSESDLVPLNWGEYDYREGGNCRITRTLDMG